MATINLTKIKDKLYLFGVTFENFKDTTGNLVGKVNIPAKLLLINNKITAEEAFYLVANKVFEACNALSYDIPNQFECNWKQVVGDKVFKDFQSAIYEEVNQRFLSNSFPEFENQDILVPNSMSIQSGGNSVDSISDYLNPLTISKLNAIDWFSIDPNNQYNPEYDISLMYANMSNMSLAPSNEKQFIMSSEDGSKHLEPVSKYATSNSILETNEKLNATNEIVAQNKSNITELITQLSNAPLATQNWVMQHITSLPECENWNASKTYHVPQFVTYNGKLFWNLRNDNLNKIPGAISGEGYWEQIQQISEASKDGEIVYYAGTDIKVSRIAPNQNWYVNLNNIKNFTTLHDLYIYLSNNFGDLALTLENIENFVNNFCGSIDNLTTVCQKIINFYLSGILEIPAFEPGEYKVFYSKPRFEEYIQSIGYSSSHHTPVKGKYIVQGDGQDIGGTNYINKNNLPTDTFTTNSGGDHSHSISYYGSGGSSSSKEYIMMKTASDNSLKTLTTEATGSHSHSFQLNTGTITEFKPAYYEVYFGGIGNNSSTYNYKKRIATNGLEGFNIFVNIIDIQAFWRGNELSLALESFLYTKTEIDNLLANKINLLNASDENKIPFVSNTGNLNVDNINTIERLTNKLNEIDVVNSKVDTKISGTIADWSNEQIRLLAERLKEYLG